jgi:hypothetical protein
VSGSTTEFLLIRSLEKENRLSSKLQARNAVDVRRASESFIFGAGMCFGYAAQREISLTWGAAAAQSSLPIESRMRNRAV